MAKVIKKSVIPVYAVAAVWLLFGLFFPLYLLWHFLLAIALSVAAFIVAKRLCPDVLTTIPDPTPAPVPSGNPALDALITQRDLALSEMRRLDENIANVAISAQIVQIETLTRKITTHVAEHPEKLPQLRKFLNYYLPTTLKLLNAYDRMDAAGVAGANIDGTMGKIETMMTAVVAAFEHQLDALFADEAMDISTDITVLENLLAQEGLGEHQLHAD